MIFNESRRTLAPIASGGLMWSFSFLALCLSSLVLGIDSLNRTKQKFTTCHILLQRNRERKRTQTSGKCRKWRNKPIASAPASVLSFSGLTSAAEDNSETLNHAGWERARGKSIASAPQHFHSLLTQLVSAPTITPGKLVHMFLVWVIYRWIGTKQELRKGHW